MGNEIRVLRSLAAGPLRLGLHTTRSALRVTRDLADLGLATLELVERVIAEVPPEMAEVEVAEVGVDAAPAGMEPEEAELATTEEQRPDDRELVAEVAESGAEDGAGASLRVAPPFPGYDALRGPDVIARLRSADVAELGETELYERTHRGRRTVLDAIARELGRRGPA